MNPTLLPPAPSYISSEEPSTFHQSSINNSSTFTFTYNTNGKQTKTDQLFDQTGSKKDQLFFWRFETLFRSGGCVSWRLWNIPPDVRPSMLSARISACTYDLLADTERHRPRSACSPSIRDFARIERRVTICISFCGGAPNPFLM